MRNIDRIKQLLRSPSKLAKFLEKNGSKFVVYKVNSDYTDINHTEQWLLQEVTND